MAGFTLFCFSTIFNGFLRWNSQVPKLIKLNLVSLIYCIIDFLIYNKRNSCIVMPLLPDTSSIIDSIYVKLTLHCFPVCWVNDLHRVPDSYAAYFIAVCLPYILLHINQEMNFQPSHWPRPSHTLTHTQAHTHTDTQCPSSQGASQSDSWGINSRLAKVSLERSTPSVVNWPRHYDWNQFNKAGA